MARYVKMHKLPKVEQVAVKGNVRALEAKDLQEVWVLMNKFMMKFKVKFMYSKKELGHLLLQRENVIHSFVVEDPASKKVTDFFSFYILPFQVLSKNNPHQKIITAYSFYNATSVNEMEDLMKMALLKARDLQVDVFNALNIMDNHKFLDSLKFSEGDGHLYYYLYNWKLKEGLTPEDIATILL
mmetsp:Transcript_45593/g.33337  ORF Transcript_45593/g.33337 Transcript_45593/m.33337 type:complete len:184 (+) Transcript_45593:849-1400(+)